MSSQLVVVQLGSARLEIPRKELQCYPDSLLSTMVASIAPTAGGTANKRRRVESSSAATSPDGQAAQSNSTNDTISLHIAPTAVPSNPLMSWELAPSIVPNLYRYKPIPAGAWADFLAAAGCSSSSDLETLFRKLTDLLKYLNMPGPVSKWLPQPEGIQLQHARVLKFWGVVTALEQVLPVVDMMMQYKPWAKCMPGRTYHAVFLLFATASGSNDMLPVLRACVLLEPCPELLSVCSAKLRSGIRFDHTLKMLPDMSDVPSSTSRLLLREDSSVGADDPLFGRCITSVISKATAGTGVTISSKSVKAEGELAGWVLPGRLLNLWVAKW